MPEMLEQAVAKKSAKPTSKAVPVPPPEAPGRKPMAVQIRGSEAFKLWMEELAGVERDTVSKLVERLARKYAQSIGFRDMPDR